MKPWYLSKTLWFNALTIITAIATVLGYVPDQQLMVNVSTWALLLSPLINILLRFFTKKQITLS